MKVDHHKKPDHINTRLLIAVWGLGLILIGGLSLIPGDQTDLAMLGLGILLLGLNLARYLNHIQVSYFSITIGGISLGVAAWLMLRPENSPELELELFPVLLIVLGLYLLIPSPKRVNTTKCCKNKLASSGG